MELPKFEEWPKTPRLKGCGMVITEKLDGTNAQVYVGEDGLVLAASRNRWLVPEQSDNNYGFRAWVEAHADELRALGPGRHYGEWWGLGIGRGYGLFERRFSLFNTGRWLRPDSGLPACCSVVPVLYAGTFDQGVVDAELERLRVGGSVAAPGYMAPEGVCVWLSASRTIFKVPFKEGHKGNGNV